MEIQHGVKPGKQSAHQLLREIENARAILASRGLQEQIAQRVSRERAKNRVQSAGGGTGTECTADSVEPVRSAATTATPYNKPSSTNASPSPLCSANQPSRKLMVICKIVATTENADSVRPIKRCGTIPISEDCVSTPPSARHAPNNAFIATAAASHRT